MEDEPYPYAEQLGNSFQARIHLAVAVHGEQFPVPGHLDVLFRELAHIFVRYAREARKEEKFPDKIRLGIAERGVHESFQLLGCQVLPFLFRAFRLISVERVGRAFLPVHPYMLLESPVERIEICQQRLLSGGHSQQQVSHVPGANAFPDFRLLPVDRKSDRPYSVQPAVDFPGEGAFARGVSAGPYSHGNRHFCTEGDLGETVDRQSGHNRASALIVPLVPFRIECYPYFFFFYKSLCFYYYKINWYRVIYIYEEYGRTRKQNPTGEDRRRLFSSSRKKWLLLPTGQVEQRAFFERVSRWKEGGRGGFFTLLRYRKKATDREFNLFLNPSYSAFRQR